SFARDQRTRANEFAQDVWQMIRNRRCRNQKFRRESPIPPYTADFCCVDLKLIVEVDGGHHQTNEGRQHDQCRDHYLAEQGYRVLRIPGFEVLRNAAAVRQKIEQAIDEPMEGPAPSSPALLPHDQSEHHSLSSRGRREPERLNATAPNRENVIDSAQRLHRPPRPRKFGSARRCVWSCDSNASWTRAFNCWALQPNEIPSSLRPVPRFRRSYVPSFNVIPMARRRGIFSLHAGFRTVDFLELRPHSVVVREKMGTVSWNGATQQ
ncbi:MAG: DUF559 domain-containing protein, partial [Phycisphaera sp. RhM]|nr:DUF559 domain-containing protein [Phycisphaera sp. RhM]